MSGLSSSVSRKFSARSRESRIGRSCSSTTAAPTTTLAAIAAANSARPARPRPFPVAQLRQGSRAHRRPRPCPRRRRSIPIDVDLQDPPEVLPEMVAKWREGYDMVYGVRRNRDERQPAQAPHRRPLLSRAQCGLERQDPRECRRLPPARPQGGRRDPRAARAQPLHEGPVRLGRLPPGSGRTTAPSARSARPSSTIGSCGPSRSTASPRPRPRRCASGAISARSIALLALALRHLHRRPHPDLRHRRCPAMPR